MKNCENEVCDYECGENGCTRPNTIPCVQDMECSECESCTDCDTCSVGCNECENGTFNFGIALALLKQGAKVRRLGWNGKGIHIELQRPDEHSKMTLPYIYIETSNLQSDNPNAPRGRVPWLASQTDMLAEDWEIVL